MKNRRLLVATLLALLFVQVSRIAAQDDVPDIDLIIANMALEQKVGQMFMVNLYGPQLTYAGRDILETWQPGAVVLLESNIGTPEEITQLANSYQEAITTAGGIPLFIAVDQEGGIIQRLKDGFTTWPAPMLYAAVQDDDLIQRAGFGLASELRAVGINMNLAPVADLNTNINNPIIGRRSAGSDPEIVANMLTNFVAGMQSAGVLATLKHFPGHGDTREDSHIDLPEVSLSLDRLSTVEMIPFGAGSGAIMTGHLWMSAIDPTPMPASLSPSIVTGLLRDTQHYNGIIITDALDMDAIDTRYSSEEAAVTAVLAGNDMILIGAHVGEQTQARAMQAVVDAVNNGIISETQIDESVRRILSAKVEMGILTWTPLDPATATLRISALENDTLINDLFQAGVTIAFDRNNLLSQISESSVNLIYPGTRPRIGDSCKLHNNLHSLAVSNSPGQAEIDTVQRLGETADISIVFTTDALNNSAQQQMINALPPEHTIVVALASPYDILQFPDISTYVVTYSPIDPAPAVACQILFGQIEAIGHLPVTFPDAN